jgi:hypothetical protein
MTLIAQLAGWGFGQLAIAMIIILAVVAIVAIAVRAMNIPVPAWVWQVLGVILVAAVCIVAVRFLLSL